MAAQFQTLTSFNAVMKYLYDQTLEFEFYRESAFLDLVPKKEDFVGNNSYQVPIMYAPNGGMGGTFAGSQTQQLPAGSNGFSVPRVSLYYTFTVDRQAWKASMSDLGAFYDARLAELKVGQKMLSRNIGVSLYGRANGVRGVVSAVAPATNGQSTDQLTLTNVSDVTHFEKNMPIGAGIIKSASIDFNQAVVARYTQGTSPLVITNIDRDNGILFFASGTIATTMGGNGTTPQLAVGDGLFLDGTGNAACNGLPDWLPLATPTTGSTFLGVDRSADTSRLAGTRFNGTQYNLKEALTNGLAQVQRESEGSPDLILISTRRWGDLSNLQDSKRNYPTERKSQSGWGYASLWVDSPHGACEVVGDNAAPDDRAFVLQLDTWELKSLDKLIDLADEDGLQQIRVYNADAFETRLISYYNLICWKPANNGVISLP